jgi:Domain of unknown function DUF29
MGDYDSNIVAWSEHQARLLRRIAAGETINDQIDWPNIIGEVETVGRSERSALRRLIGTVLEHLMKLQASPAREPRNGWKDSINRARRDIDRVLKDSPSLRCIVADMIVDETPATAKLVGQALALFGEQPRVDAWRLTFTENQVLGEWFPDDPA